MYFTSDDKSQNTFVCQPIIDTLESKKDKFTDYILGWKSNEKYNSKLKVSCTALLHSIKFSGYKMGIKCDKDPLSVEQNNYLTKIVDFSIAYDLAAWPRNTTDSFKFKN